jgi:hypothetical protein
MVRALSFGGLTIAMSAATALAQNGARAGVESITEADVRSRVFIIADDSMGGRDTPSPGLEKTARYISAEFKRFGLEPGGDSNTFVQRYDLSRRRLDGKNSHITLRLGSEQSVISYDKDARYAGGARGGAKRAGGALLVGGTVNGAALANTDVSGKAVLFVVDYSKPMEGLDEVAGALMARGATALLLLSNRDTATFARRRAEQFREQMSVGAHPNRGPIIAEVLDRSVATPLRAAGIDLAEVRTSKEAVIRPLEGAEVSASVVDLPGGQASAPNVVGILEGSDPVLKNEYIVFSAHMDHEGTRSGATPDSIWNGADDDASGTAGVMELAEAFSRPGARPRRSLIFVTVSGEEKGLWGSEHFAGNPPVPIDKIVANLNLDMIGRNWKDTIVVIGKEHSDLGSTLNRVNAEHPELNMRAIDDLWPQENFYFRSDHFNFAKRGVPVLFFFNGTHKDYHQPSDTPDKIDAEKEARILKLIYYIGQEVGNAAEKPRWNPESYKQIVRE